MRNLTTDYVLSNRSQWREAVEVDCVLIEKFGLDKFNGKKKMTVQTKDGSIDLFREYYEMKLREGNENQLYMIYHVSLEDKKISKRYTKQFSTGARVLDRSLVTQKELIKLGYSKYKFGLYKKRIGNPIKVFVSKEALSTRALVEGEMTTYNGKAGDIVLIYGHGDYRLIPRSKFEEQFELLRLDK